MIGAPRPLLLITSERFAEHMTPPGHPERPERAEAMDAVAIEWRRRGGATAEPDSATRDELVRVHASEYLDRLESTRGRAAMLDPDTFTSPESLDVAALAAGAAIQAGRRTLGGAGPTLALVRPPGHHAERDRAMGFCLYNNVAAAAADALAVGASRVAIVDVDVHHGNGTQWIFYAEPRVLYVSTHQFPFYPGTGAVREVGDGKGEGFTVNVPLAVGATDADYRVVYDEVVLPVVDSFAPDLMLVSAGFDAHERDPLAGMRVSTAGYAAIVQRLREVSERTCDGRIALVTEGGYDLQALAECLNASMAVLEGKDAAHHNDAKASYHDDHASNERGRRAVEAVRAAQKRFWPQL
jgi:acetoin utilization deacetylase AcuC-like enzyme